MIGFGNRDEAIVTDLLLAVELLAFDDSDQPCANGNSRECRFIHEQKYIDRVAIGRESLRQKAKIVREDHSGRKNFLQHEDPLLGIESELVTASLGCFDDD